MLTLHSKYENTEQSLLGRAAGEQQRRHGGEDAGPA